MAKIGVLTFFGTTDNYGQVLQYLATQEYLNSLGNSTSLIVPKGYERTFWRRVKWKIQNYYAIITNFLYKRKKTVSITCGVSKEEQAKLQVFKKWAEVSKRQELEHPRCFDKFRSNFFSIQIGTYDELLASGYDAFCIGSDQTWSAGGFEMMLGWVPKKYPRFSIAPSVGHRIYSHEEVLSFRKYLQAFDFITVRESKGIDLATECGRKDAVKVLDPTFLLSSKEYDKFAVKSPKNESYILIYLLGGEIEKPVAEIEKYCKEKGCRVKYVESQGRDENCPKIFPTVEEWLGLVSNASYVITNSFHGMAFSIIYHKPFLVFPLVGLMEGMNGRVVDLSNTFSLENRVYDGNMDVLFEPISWMQTDEVIAHNKDILTTLIKNIKLS